MKVLACKRQLSQPGAVWSRGSSQSVSACSRLRPAPFVAVQERLCRQRSCCQAHSKAMRLNDLATIPGSNSTPAPTTSPVEPRPLNEKSTSARFRFGNAHQEVVSLKDSWICRARTRTHTGKGANRIVSEEVEISQNGSLGTLHGIIVPDMLNRGHNAV